MTDKIRNDWIRGAAHGLDVLNMELPGRRWRGRPHRRLLGIEDV